MEKDKETKKELEEQVEELKKSNKVMKSLLIVLVVLILFGTCFGGGFLIGQKLAEKEEDVLEENKKDDKTEEKEDNTISDALRKDLDKKVNLTAHFVTSGLTWEGSEEEIKNIIAENEYAYAYFAYATYNYYLYKTGKTIEPWSTNDMSYGPCYKDGQNGYCFPMDKEDILKYEKELYNIGVRVFDLGEGYSIVKGDKVYVTSVPWNGAASTEITEVVSVVKNNDNIEYIAKHKMTIGTENIANFTIKYIFKANEDGNFYLYAFEKM